MAAHERGARDGRDIEELHGMRVAARRMRAALRVLGPSLETKAYKPFRKALRRTGRIRGRVRDEVLDHLGDLPDAVVTCRVLQNFLARGTWGDDQARTAAAPDVILAPGVTTYLSVRQAELQRLLREFHSLWKKLSGEDFRQKLFMAMAAL